MFVDFGAAPNPFAASGGTVLRFLLPAASPVGLRVYDGSGRLVRERRDLNAPAGEYRFHWDGRGDTGQPQPNGVYFYRLEAGDLTSIGKISLVR
jgi:flagellar hook assembly protein FlgD